MTEWLLPPDHNDPAAALPAIEFHITVKFYWIIEDVKKQIISRSAPLPVFLTR